MGIVRNGFLSKEASPGAPLEGGRQATSEAAFLHTASCCLRVSFPQDWTPLTGPHKAKLKISGSMFKKIIFHKTDSGEH